MLQWAFTYIGYGDKMWLTDGMDPVCVTPPEEGITGAAAAHEDSLPAVVRLQKIVTNMELVVNKCEVRIRMNNSILRQRVTAVKHLETFILALIRLVFIATQNFIILFSVHL